MTFILVLHISHDGSFGVKYILVLCFLFYLLFLFSINYHFLCYKNNCHASSIENLHGFKMYLTLNCYICIINIEVKEQKK